MVHAQAPRRLVTVIAILASVLMLGLSYQPHVAAGPARQTPVDFEWRLANPPTAPIVITPGTESSTVIAGFSLNNTSAVTNTYQLEATSLPRGWRAEFSVNRITLAPRSIFSGISARLIIPAGTPVGSLSVTLSATRLPSAADATSNRADIFIPLTVITGSPVPPTPLPSGCPDVPDPGNNYDSAQLVRVDLEEAHGICTTGDEDWFRFAAVGGKVYTIEISQMDVGLDLSLELYDDQRNRIASNDDFYDRTPGEPDPFDKRPRINSWRAPRDGIYVVRVRDNLSIGGNSLAYRFVVLGESYGPTPTTVAEICNDFFEPDGLPEIAKLIFSNETQPRRTLCPTGDADWVQFFGVAGRLYVIYTDTRPYAADPSDPLTFPEPGADTILFLVDRDGQRLLDFNNDIPGGNSLDSEIQFRPVVDGFYYLQVKNVGDIGSEFIKYNLTVRACPGEYCRPDRPGAPAPPAEPVPTFGLSAGQ